MKAGLSERSKKHFLTEKDSAGFVNSKEKNEWVLNKAGVKRELFDTVKARKLAYYGYTVNEETRELPGERDNAKNNARCTKAMNATHGLDGQHQDVDRTLRGRVSQNDRGQG